MKSSDRKKDGGSVGFSQGDRVEVLSEEEGFSSAWAAGTLVSLLKGGLWLVEYSKFIDGDGKALREKVRPFQTSWCPAAVRRAWLRCRKSGPPQPLLHACLHALQIS